MKLSVTIVDNAADMAPITFRGDYAQSIKKAGEIGYDGIELHIQNPQDIDVKEFRKMLDEAGIVMTSIGTGSSRTVEGLCLTSEDENIRVRAIERLKQYIDLGKEFNSVIIIGLMRGLKQWCSSPEAFEFQLRKSLDTAIAYAEEKEVVVVIEAINRYENDFCISIRETVEYCKTYNSDYIKVHIDTFHMNIEDGDITKEIKDGGKYIGHVHLADSNRYYPGRGHYDFKETLDALKFIGYDGALALECYNNPDSETTAVGAYETMSKLIKK